MEGCPAGSDRGEKQLAPVSALSWEIPKAVKHAGGRVLNSGLPR